MDFCFRETQHVVRDLARGILEQEVDAERLKAAEAAADRFDAALWARLAEANLLGIPVPESLGGMGMGFLEVCTLLEELGRVVAPAPVLPTLVLGALPLAEAGSEAQRRRWLPAVAAGEAILGAALAEDPPSRAVRDGSEWILEGVAAAVPAAHLAARILVPARTGSDLALFLVDPGAAGARLTRGRASTGEPLCELALDGVRVAAADRLGDAERDATALLERLADLARVAGAAMQLGVSARALEITAGHVRERVQFGVPIGTFQAVQHRAADCWTDLAAMRWTTWRAAWLLDEGRPARRAAAVARFWAAEGGARIAAAAQHLHGGLGVDLDYPIHRYFLASKALELGGGGPTEELARLGRDMARSGPEELA